MSYRRFITSDPDVAVQPVTKMLTPQHLVLNDAARVHLGGQASRASGGSQT